MSPLSRFLIFPGVCAKWSQIDSPLPSSFHAPSIWYEAVAVPQKKFLGKGISEEAAACRAGALMKAGADDVGPAALDEMLHAEKKPAGSAATAVALAPDCSKSRRYRRKGETSFKRETAEITSFDVIR